MATVLTSMSFPSDPVNEAAWKRLKGRPQLPFEWGPFGGGNTKLHLHFAELDEFERWCTANNIYVDYIEPDQSLICIRIYSSDQLLTYAKLKWGGRRGPA